MADLEPGCRTRSIVMVALAFVASTTSLASLATRSSGSRVRFRSDLRDGFESGDFRYWDRGVGAPPERRCRRIPPKPRRASTRPSRSIPSSRIGSSGTTPIRSSATLRRVRSTPAASASCGKSPGRSGAPLRAVA